MKWLTLLLEKWACMHEWEPKTWAKWRDKDDGRVTYQEELYICAKCGKFKKVGFGV